MSRATILFYNEKLNTEPIFKKVVLANGFSKSEFTDFLFWQAKEASKLFHYDNFAIVDRIDTVTEVKK